MILVLNCGSSSIKYRTFAADLTQLASGIVEHVGEASGPRDHASAMRRVLAQPGVDIAGIAAVGHRVAHGGTRFATPIRLDADVLAELAALTPLAPLHNPPALAGIAVARQLLPDAVHVAVFDTAFHATLPAAATTYAIDAQVAARYGIRRFGFHGTSHRYVSGWVAERLGRPIGEVNTIVLHLGNGASACAVRGGRSVETSMGLTPLEGLVMGGRSGDIDPAVILHLQRTGGYSPDDVDDLLNRQAGLRGLCGDNDMRAVVSRRAAGDPAAELAFDVYCHRLRKYIGAYAAVLGHLDAIAFTGGVGEHSPEVRAASTAGLGILGVAVDDARNEAATAGAHLISPDYTISPDYAPVAVFAVPTDEELEIARQTVAMVPTGATRRAGRRI